jgi:hypothetical protein
MSLTKVGQARLEQKRKVMKWFTANRKLWDDKDFLANVERRKKLALRMVKEGLYSTKTHEGDLIRSQTKFIEEIKRIG